MRRLGLLLHCLFLLVSSSAAEGTTGQKLFLNSTCYKSSSDWTSAGVPKKIARWLDSAESFAEQVDKTHPSLRALFDGARPHFLSAAPRGGGISWKRFGAGENDLDGWIYGRVNGSSQFTGDNIAFLYAGFDVALVGKYQTEHLAEGRAARIVACRCRGGVMELRLRRLRYYPRSPYTLDPLRYLSLPRTSLQVDPLDRRNVFVGRSTLGRGAGEGLFARRAIPKDGLIASYGGSLTSTSLDAKEKCNETLDLTENFNKNLIKYSPGYRLDVPLGWESVERYRATLGHKANHGFVPNGVYEFYVNPRFGRIRCIQALRPIRRHEEIFVHYSYKAESPFVSRWYKEKWRKFREENPGCDDP